MHNSYKSVALLAVVSLLQACSFAGSFGGGAVDPSSSRFGPSAQEVAQVQSRWIPSPVTKLPDPPLLVNSEVRREVKSLLRGQAACIRSSLDRRQPHYPTIAKIFDDEGVPRDMLNLAIVESRFQSEARSPTGAVGIWQFTKSTGKLYGLRIDNKIDERKDPIRSTLAAARHLRDLFQQFQDWYLVLAAYNAGPGAVMKAMQKTGSDDFWALARRGKLSNETKEFVPRFIAATILVRTAELSGIEDLATEVETRMAKIPTEGSRFAQLLAPAKSDSASRH